MAFTLVDLLRRFMSIYKNYEVNMFVTNKTFAARFDSIAGKLGCDLCTSNDRMI